MCGGSLAGRNVCVTPGACDGLASETIRRVMSEQQSASVPKRIVSEVPLKYSEFLWSLEKLRYKDYGPKMQERFVRWSIYGVTYVSYLEIFTCAFW